MEKFNSFEEAQERALTLQTGKVVTSILCFIADNKKYSNNYFLFHSVAGHLQQLITKNKDLWTFGNVGVYDSIEERDRALLEAYQQSVDDPQMEFDAPGHAEEYLIHHFEQCLEQCNDQSIKDVQIYLNYSPCSGYDNKPSDGDSQNNTPSGCLAKLANLANQHGSLEFSVIYNKDFGNVQQIANAIGTSSEDILNGFELPHNLKVMKL